MIPLFLRRKTPLFLKNYKFYQRFNMRCPKTCASTLDEELQKLKQAGIPTTLEELAPPEIPDSENAALVYQKVFGLMDNRDMEEIQSLPSYSDVTKWSEEQKKEIPLLIERNKEIYKLLEKATALPKCRFALRYEDGPGVRMFHISKLRMCARLLAVKSILEAENGQIEKGLNSCITGMKLSQSLSNQPVLINQLVRMAMNSLLLRSLEEILNKGDFDNRLYEELIKEMKRERESHLISFGLKGEGVLGGLWIYNRIKKGPIKDTSEKDTFELFSIFGMDKITGLEEMNKLIKEYLPFAEKDIVFHLQTILKLISLTKEPYWQVKDELKEIEKSIVTLPKENYLLSEMLLPALVPAYTKEARSDALLGAAEIGIANRIYRQKYGKFADSLTQLTPEILSTLPLDPFNGKDYIYRKTEKGFIVYSVGEDLKDDGGIEEKSSLKPDIVWECEK